MSFLHTHTCTHTHVHTHAWRIKDTIMLYLLCSMLPKFPGSLSHPLHLFWIWSTCNKDKIKDILIPTGVSVVAGYVLWVVVQLVKQYRLWPLIL